MAVQTSYSTNFGAAIAGQLAENTHVSSLKNDQAATIPAGVGVSLKAAGTADLPAGATEKLAGVVVNSYARNPNDLTGTGAILDQDMMNVLDEGAIYVVTEETIAVTDSVYMRHTANGAGKLQLGAFRNDADGVAQVTTGTPTAAQHSTLFLVRVKFADESYNFAYTSDGSMTATEVNDALRALMAANTAFTARVVASGTATLILTGQVAGEAFTVTDHAAGIITWVATTPPAPTCRKVKGARWLVGCTGAGVAKLFLSVTADNATL